jgi:cation transport ATPase
MWSHLSCPVIENIIWIEPLLRGHLSFRSPPHKKKKQKQKQKQEAKNKQTKNQKTKTKQNTTKQNKSKHNKTKQKQRRKIKEKTVICGTMVLSVYILMSFDFPFGILFAVRQFYQRVGLVQSGPHHHLTENQLVLAMI